MSAAIDKRVLLAAMLLAAGAMCPPPQKLKDFPSPKLLKGDVFKMDLA